MAVTPEGPMQQKLLIVDDEESNRRLIGRIFEGFTLLEAGDGRSALAIAAREKPDAILLDVIMPDMDGLTALEKLRELLPETPVIMLTGSRDVRHAVRATRLGAFDYLTKPIDRDEILVVVERALEQQRLLADVQRLRREVRNTPGAGLAAQMGPGAATARIIAQVEKVAASTFTVLILGETGTGKELVAHAIHQASARRGRPFVALDCGAIPELLLESELFGHERGAFTGADRRKEGQFRLAEGGTCFLDEIGNMPLGLQVKLLRALESKQVQAVGAERPLPMDVRFLAATNDDLQARVSGGRFRADLYFRLAQYTIRLPPLRERADDLPYLAERFVEEAATELRRPVQAITPAAIERLRGHDWPGNVRELRNVVRQAVLHADGFAVQAADIAFDRRAAVAPRIGGTAGASLRETARAAAAAAERQAIVEALGASGGNKSRAAKALATDYKTLHVKMKQLGIRARDFHGT